MELLVKINKKLEQRRAILNTIIQNVGIQNKILKSAQILAECLKLGGKIITAGNGGSASQSEHFSSEMMGRLKNSRTPFPSLSLSSNASLLTCIGNDFGFERIFSRQIEGIGTTKDVFIAFTTSCKSRNIIEALNVCKNSNIKSIVFTGQCVHDIDLLAEEIIMIPSNDVQIIQECHDIISHIVCELVEEIVDLKTLPNYYQLKTVRFEPSIDNEFYCGSFFETIGNFVKFKLNGTATFFYYKYPTIIDEDTADDFKLELDQDALNIAPTGIAGTILMTDISNQYGAVFLNNYEQMLQRLDSRGSDTLVQFKGGF